MIAFSVNAFAHQTFLGKIALPLGLEGGLFSGHAAGYVINCKFQTTPFWIANSAARSNPPETFTAVSGMVCAGPGIGHVYGEERSAQ